MKLFNRYDPLKVLNRADPYLPFAEQVLWIESLFLTIRYAKINEQKSHLPPEIARIHHLFEILTLNEAWRLTVAKVLQNVLGQSTLLRLFSQTGLLREGGFFSEAMDRLLSRLLPRPIAENDFSETFLRIFSQPGDESWVKQIDNQTFKQVVDLLAYGENRDSFLALKNGLYEALLVLGTHVAEIGLYHEVRERTKYSRVFESPFLNLNQKIGHFITAQKENYSTPEHRNIVYQSCVEEIARCRLSISDVYNHLDEKGVSLKIVYRLENLIQSIDRIEILVNIANIRELDTSAIRTTLNFIALLIEEQRDQKSLRGLIQDNLRLLSKKIVERVGATGDHYITRTPGEYLKMFIAGAGGGLFMGFTTIGKFTIAKLHLPLFIEGFLHALNYSGTFIFLQATHLTLATKQPAMTGPALALKLTDIDRAENLKSFIDEVVQIMRSQFAAIVGNVGLVIPSALVLDHYYRQWQGTPIFTEEYALKTVASLHPLTSLTVPFAIFTGVLLWLSAIISGSVENWYVYRRFSDALSQSRRLNHLFGKKMSQWISNLVSKNIAGLSANISIGFMLAYTPIMGQFFGLPLDVRHVTLSSGFATLAASKLIECGQFQAEPFILAGVGILFVGALNVLVSFFLALSVAMRARNIRLRWIWILMRAVFTRFKSSPKEFFWI